METKPELREQHIPPGQLNHPVSMTIKLLSSRYSVFNCWWRIYGMPSKTV